MQKLIFTLRYLLKGRGNNGIKLISLSLGLAVGILLLTHIAYEKSFDTCFPDYNQIYQVTTVWKTGETDPRHGTQQNPNVLPAFLAEFPEIENGVRWWGGWPFSFFHGENGFQLPTILADPSIFDVFGISVLQGDPKALAIADNIAISSKVAQTIFGDQNPIGQILMYNRTVPRTIVAVFEALPENVSTQYDVVMSIEYTKIIGFYNDTWDGGAAFQGYLKLKKGTDPKQIEEKIPTMLNKYYDVEAAKASGSETNYYLQPIKKIHLNDGLSQTVFILSLLAQLILFVAGMNYVLISISSLATRARTIAVHKCNGASTWNIFSMFLRETGVLMIIALIIATLLIYVFKQQIATLTVVRLPALSFETLWPAGIAIVALFLLSAIIPSAMFSSIPVTQAFHKYAGGKKYWKQALLFIQFAVSAFMVALLLTTVRQYDMLMNKDIGYDYENIVYTYAPPELSFALKNELQTLPCVEGIGIGYTPFYGFNGCGIHDEQGNSLLSARNVDKTGPDYIPVMGIQMKYGKNFTENTPDNEVIVNEELVRKLNINENPVGEMMLIEGATVTIIGVVKDFQIGNLYDQNEPIVMSHANMGSGLMIRLKEVNPDNIETVNRKIVAIVGNNDISVSSMRQTFMYMYESAQRFRNSILSTSIIALIITLMGLLGYINDELRRRSKEIALRKINGAKASDVIYLVSNDTAVVFIPAVLIGLGGAYYASSRWLQSFAVKVSLPVWLFLLCGLLLLLIVATAVFLKTRKTANENPVKAIKTE